MEAFLLTMLISSASDKCKLRVLLSPSSLPFWVKEKANMLKNEIREVKELDSWRSSIPLLQSLYSTGGWVKKPSKKIM